MRRPRSMTLDFIGVTEGKGSDREPSATAPDCGFCNSSESGSLTTHGCREETRAETPRGGGGMSVQETCRRSRVPDAIFSLVSLVSLVWR
jgi:hypothetical protein